MKGQEVLLSSKNMEWETPQKLFDELNKEFQSTTDACSTVQNSKCPMRRTDFLGIINEFNTLNDSIFMNPPYGRNIANKSVSVCHC